MSKTVIACRGARRAPFRVNVGASRWLARLSVPDKRASHRLAPTKEVALALVLLVTAPFVAAQADTRAPSQKEQPAPTFRFLNTLVQEALTQNPSIRAARRRWEAATKRPSQVSSLPNPEISFSSFGSPRPIFQPADPLNWREFMFMQSIPWPGKLSLRGDIAGTEASQESQNYQAVTLHVLRQLKESYFELHLIDRSREILEKNQRLLEQLARISEARYAVGEGLQQDVLKAQVEISLIVERLELVNQQRESVQARINSLLNRSPDVTLPQIEPIREISAQIPFSLEALYLKARESNPRIEAERLEIQKASLQLDLARKEFFPDFNASASLMDRHGPFKDMYEVRLGVQVPLYFWRKERLGVEENVAELERAREGYRERLQDVTFRIKDAYVGSRTAQRLLELYRRGIIPQAVAALDSALAAYEVGTVDFLTLLTNALTILNYELEYEESIRDYHQNLVRLEELLGFVFVK